MMDTYLLLILLPEDKFVAWMVDLETIIRNQRCSHADLDSLVGRLNHAAMVTPMAQHFFGRLQQRIDYYKPQTATLLLAKDEVKDLKLWRKILLKAATGISMNLITVRSPSPVCWSDACPFGLGGYSVSGRA
jgi:hypothetical protein